jgi:hypothetical protein
MVTNSLMDRQRGKIPAYPVGKSLHRTQWLGKAHFLSMSILLDRHRSRRKAFHPGC